MRIFPVAQLEVLGFWGAEWPDTPNQDNGDRPTWSWPILRVAGGGPLLLEMEDMTDDPVAAEEILEPSRVDGYLRAQIDRGNATLLAAPIPAVRRGVFHRADGMSEYVTVDEMCTRLRRFAEEQRSIGDAHMRAGRAEQAHVAYEHAFSMVLPEYAGGWTPEDSARLLMTGYLQTNNAPVTLPGGITTTVVDLHRGSILNAGQHPDTLCAQLRAKILAS